MFKKMLLSLNLGVILFVIIYLYATGGPIPGGDFPEEGTYLFKEKMFGTLFSTLQIFLIAVAAFANAIGSLFHSKKQELLFWLLSGFGFLFLAWDEYFLIHEHLDKWLIQTWKLPENRLTDRIDDLLILIYALVGISVLKKSWGWLKTYSSFMHHIKIAFVFLFLMVLFDMGHIKLTPVKEIEEDITKLFAEAYFLLAYLSCWKKNSQDTFKP